MRKLPSWCIFSYHKISKKFHWWNVHLSSWMHMLIRLDKTEERWWGNRTILSRILCSWDLGMQRHPTSR